MIHVPSATRDRLKWLGWWLPSTVLVAVALLQFLLSQTLHLSPWLGGGFGMFASLDSPMSRGFYCEGVDEHGKRVSIRLTFSGRGPESSFDADARFRILTLPLEVELRRMGRMLLEAELVPDPKSPAAQPPVYRVRLPEDREVDPAAAVRLHAVRIAVWRLSFDPASGRLSREPVGVRVELGERR